MSTQKYQLCISCALTNYMLSSTILLFKMYLPIKGEAKYNEKCLDTLTSHTVAQRLDSPKNKLKEGGSL